jgi:predicted dienelactone hydrolase
MAARHNRIDWQRFGLIGHSLGGYTVLGLGGA